FERGEPAEGRAIARPDAGRRRRPLPAEQGTPAGRRPTRPGDRRELPAHAPRRGYGRGRGQGPGRVVDPVRRARVQREYVHGPGDRVDDGRPALRDHGGDRGAQGATPRRGEREGDGRVVRGGWTGVGGGVDPGRPR